MAPSLPGLPRIPGPWPFLDEITTVICRHAGREASAALHIALYKRNPNDIGTSAALKAVYYEPFTYWDWHGVHENDRSAFEAKRQLFWERERGCITSDGRQYGCPSPRDKWLQFQELIESQPERRMWVKSVAIAHWMTVADVEWIARKLDALEALDLGDVPLWKASLDDYLTADVAPSPKDMWPLFFFAKSSDAAVSLLPLGLRWLGLPDFRNPSRPYQVSRMLLNKFLPLCTRLQTLSIRGKYRDESQPANLSAHDDLCSFIHGIKRNVPASVTSLELRLSFPFLDRLIASLQTDSRVNIDRIGIDLGAWVQVYRPREVFDKLEEDAIVQASVAAARKARFEIYEDEHNKVLPKSSAWLLPETKASEVPITEVRSSFATDFYCDVGVWCPDSVDVKSKRYGDTECLIQSKDHDRKLVKYLKDVEVKTLPAMLLKMYDTCSDKPVICSHVRTIGLYPLEPEWQAQSINPIDPLALIQKGHGTSAPMGSKYASLDLDRLRKAYRWLETAFKWRPVFDWDCFMKPEGKNGVHNSSYTNGGLRQQSGIETAEGREGTNSRHPATILEITKQFQYMRDAGIPVHVLIGRRHPDDSSLYWGWPYDLTAWEKSLESPLDATFGSVAAHIDTLSIFYDLRNPLGEQRLEEIDQLEAYQGPEGRCPRIVCPWGDSKTCPFPKQWSSAPEKQKMANKAGLGKSRLRLASNLTSCPSIGEHADEHASDDTSPKDSAPATLHQLARRAAFEREALGWQRFWSQYAHQLINLSELRVRMPQCFDQVGSWGLSKLLKPNKVPSDTANDWKMFAYADERQHMQTREDLVQHVRGSTDGLFTHKVQEKVWSAGRFVRRTWVRRKWKVDVATQDLYREEDEVEAPGKTDTPSNSKPGTNRYDGDVREYEEFEKAVKRAREAAKRERELEAKLVSLQNRKPKIPTEAPRPESGPVDCLLEGAYGRRIHHVAEQAWRSQMQAFIDELQGGEAGTELAARNGTGPRDLLKNFRDRLHHRMDDFRPEDVFRVHDPAVLPRRNFVDLVQDGRDYAAEEQERRAREDTARLVDAEALPSKPPVLRLETEQNALPATKQSGTQVSSTLPGLSAPSYGPILANEATPVTSKGDKITPQVENSPEKSPIDDEDFYGSEPSSDRGNKSGQPDPLLELPGEQAQTSDCTPQPREQRDLSPLQHTVENGVSDLHAAATETIDTPNANDTSITTVQVQQFLVVEHKATAHHESRMERTMESQQITQVERREQAQQPPRIEDASDVEEFYEPTKTPEVEEAPREEGNSEAKGVSELIETQTTTGPETSDVEPTTEEPPPAEPNALAKEPSTTIGKKRKKPTQDPKGGDEEEAPPEKKTMHKKTAAEKSAPEAEDTDDDPEAAPPLGKASPKQQATDSDGEGHDDGEEDAKPTPKKKAKAAPKKIAQPRTRTPRKTPTPQHTPEPEVIAVTRSGRNVRRPTTRTPTPQAQLPSDLDSEEPSEEESDDEGRKKGGRGSKKETTSAGDWEPGSGKEKAPAKGGKKATRMKSGGRKRKAANDRDEEKPRKKVRKGKKVDDHAEEE